MVSSSWTNRYFWVGSFQWLNRVGLQNLVWTATCVYCFIWTLIVRLCLAEMSGITFTRSALKESFLEPGLKLTVRKNWFERDDFPRKRVGLIQWLFKFQSSVWNHKCMICSDFIACLKSSTATCDLSSTSVLGVSFQVPGKVKAPVWLWTLQGRSIL